MTTNDCTACATHSTGKYCLRHTCIDCGAYSDDVASHVCVDNDGFAHRCRYCGGECSAVAWDDPRISCDNCGEIQK